MPPPARRRWSPCMAPAWARRQLKGLVEQAQALLEPYGERALLLDEAAAFIAERQALNIRSAATSAFTGRRGTEF